MSHSWSWVRALSARRRSFALGVLIPSFRNSGILCFSKFPFEHSIIRHRSSFNCSGIFVTKDGKHCQLIPSSRFCRGFCSLPQNKVLELDSGSSDDVITSDVEQLGHDSGDGISIKKVKVIQQQSLDFTKIGIDLLPTVILVGRPNVGKSALFNRLIRRREALVYNTPADHVTRDIREGIAKLVDLRFKVLDSAGLETEAISGSILQRTASMTASVLARTQFAIFLVDARGESKVPVIRVLESCGFSTRIGITVLSDKSLVTISNNKVEMHDLLQEMGSKIVEQESNRPGEHSRLWNYEDIYRVLSKNTGTEANQSIKLDMSKTREIHYAFARMCNLELLIGSHIFWMDIHQNLCQPLKNTVRCTFPME